MEVDLIVSVTDRFERMDAWEGCYDEGSDQWMYLIIPPGLLTVARVHREIDATGKPPTVDGSAETRLAHVE